MLLFQYIYAFLVVSLYFDIAWSYSPSYTRIRQTELCQHHEQSLDSLPSPKHQVHPSHKHPLLQILAKASLVCSFAFASLSIHNQPVTAADSYDDVSRLKKGLREISYLLDHWDEKTTYCNFGEVQKDMLKTENKKQLLIAASKLSFFDYDKSATMNVMCRKDPLAVRAFLGLTKENPTLSRADVLMKKQSTVGLIDENKIEEYFDAVEQYTQAISEVDGLTYGARVDYSSTETSSKEDIASKTSDRDYLQQSKESVRKVKNALETIVQDLQL
jgi:hypothetical protein